MVSENVSSIYDVVIIGTGESAHDALCRSHESNRPHVVGLYGIQAARYYLEVHPNAKLVLLEADDVIGGTWSSSR